MADMEKGVPRDVVHSVEKVKSAQVGPMSSEHEIIERIVTLAGRRHTNATFQRALEHRREELKHCGGGSGSSLAAQLELNSAEFLHLDTLDYERIAAGIIRNHGMTSSVDNGRYQEYKWKAMLNHYGKLAPLAVLLLRNVCDLPKALAVSVHCFHNTDKCPHRRNMVLQGLASPGVHPIQLEAAPAPAPPDEKTSLALGTGRIQHPAPTMDQPASATDDEEIRNLLVCFPSMRKRLVGKGATGTPLGAADQRGARASPVRVKPPRGVVQAPSNVAQMQAPSPSQVPKASTQQWYPPVGLHLPPKPVAIAPQTPELYSPHGLHLPPKPVAQGAQASLKNIPEAASRQAVKRARDDDEDRTEDLAMKRPRNEGTSRDASVLSLPLRTSASLVPSGQRTPQTSPSQANVPPTSLRQPGKRARNEDEDSMQNMDTKRPRNERALGSTSGDVPVLALPPRTPTTLAPSVQRTAFALTETYQPQKRGYTGGDEDESPSKRQRTGAISGTVVGPASSPVALWPGAHRPIESFGFERHPRQQVGTQSGLPLSPAKSISLQSRNAPILAAHVGNEAPRSMPRPAAIAPYLSASHPVPLSVGTKIPLPKTSYAYRAREWLALNPGAKTAKEIAIGIQQAGSSTDIRPERLVIQLDQYLESAPGGKHIFRRSEVNGCDVYELAAP